MLKGLNYDRNIVQFYGARLQTGRDPMLVCEYMEGACRNFLLHFWLAYTGCCA